MCDRHLPSIDLNQCISDFFRDPRNVSTGLGYFSSLYLLRRDSAQCLGFDPNTFQSLPDGTPRALWPGLMATFAGIDLLGKFYSDNDDRGQVTARFTCYLRSFVLPSEAAFVDPIWRLRNSMMHSFGLYGGNINGHEEWYVLSTSLPQLLNEQIQFNERYVYLDIIQFWRRFETSIQNFQTWLLTNYASLQNFPTLLRRYGFTPVSIMLTSVSTLTPVVSGGPV
jgi:hypothetical protein